MKRIIILVMIFMLMIPAGYCECEELSIRNGLVWGQTISDVKEIFDDVWSEEILSDDRHSLSSCTLSSGLIDSFPGYVNCYFLDGGLACVVYELEGYEDPNCDIYFDNLFYNTYGSPTIKADSETVESLIIWECFTSAVGHMYIVWDVMEQYEYEDLWEIGDDTMAIVFENNARAVAFIANREKTAELWDWFAYRERVYDYELRQQSYAVPEILDAD